MSTNVLKLIPTSPQFVPNEATIDKALKLLAEFFPEARQVTYTVTDQVQFVDPGANFERVSCPLCGTEIDDESWRQAMDAAYQTDFRDLSARVPCCGGVVSLNDLQYEWPAGFARFELQVYEPGADIDDEKLELLRSALGCDLRKIWAHY